MIKIKNINLSKTSLSDSNHYSYYSIKNYDHPTHITIGPAFGIIYLLNSSHSLDLAGHSLSEDHFLTFSFCTERTLTLNSCSHFLFIYSNSISSNDFVKTGTLHKSKFVNKPWGYEKWIAHRSNPFSFKKIFIKQGYRTSLQYHIKKEETNFLYSGKAKLHYSDIPGTEYTLDKDNILAKNFFPGQCCHIPTDTIHRIEAISDITLFEASTNELDDVIRIQDDNNRDNGKIASEHLAPP